MGKEKGEEGGENPEQDFRLVKSSRVCVCVCVCSCACIHPHVCCLVCMCELFCLHKSLFHSTQADHDSFFLCESSPFCETGFAVSSDDFFFLHVCASAYVWEKIKSSTKQPKINSHVDFLTPARRPDSSLFPLNISYGMWWLQEML